MKRIKQGILILSVATLLAGCGAQMPEMTKEQSKQISEFAAGLLMKYDESHESRIMNDVELEAELERLQALAERKAELAAMEEALKAEKEKNKAEDEEENQEIAIIPQANTSSGKYVDEFYGIEGITIRYQSYALKDSYPESDEELYFQMQASNGKKLLVVYFEAKNETTEKQNLDMITIMPRFKIGINRENAQYALSTLLSDDLANYRGTLEAGESVSLVLIAEVSEEMAGNIDWITLMMENDSNSATILMN